MRRKEVFMPQPVTRRSEENDLPFFKNELRNQPATTGKPLDASDEPGRADSEMAEGELDLKPPALRAGGSGA
jgi:hypothetical protein